MLPKKITDKWRSDYDKQLIKAEKKFIPKISRYYQQEYNIGIKNFIETGDTGYTTLFKYGFFNDIYLELYNDISMQFAFWYARNFEDYESKKNPRDYTDTWRNAFNYFAGKVAATNVSLVSGTAKKTLIRITQRLFRDPNFTTLGAGEKARILRSKFKRYSQVQAERLVRTEACRAASYGIEQSALQVYAGRNLKKQWVAYVDDRTRDWHIAVNGDVQDFEKPFLVGGEQMMRPGDGSGYNVINCRCSMIPFPAELESTILSI